MSELIKDAAYGGFVEDVPGDDSFFTLAPVSPSLAMVIDRSAGNRRATDVLVGVVGAWAYVTPASGVEGGWRQVFTTQIL